MIGAQLGITRRDPALHHTNAFEKGGIDRTTQSKISLALAVAELTLPEARRFVPRQGEEAPHPGHWEPRMDAKKAFE